MVKHLLAGALFFFSLAIFLVAQTFTGVSLIGVRLGAQAGTGDVVGPSSSTNGQVATFSGTTGKLIAAFTGSGLYRFASGIPTLITPGTNGNCVQWSTSTGLSDAGAPCGSGGGGGSYSAGDGIGISGSTISVDSSVPSIGASGSQSVTFGTISSSTCPVQTISAPGAVLGDGVISAWPTTLPDGLIGNMRVTATDQISITLCKVTSGSASVTGLTFGYTVVRSR